MSNYWICEASYLAFNILPMLSKLNLALLFYHHLLDFVFKFVSKIFEVGYTYFHV
jgi:hypothetical protein